MATQIDPFSSQHLEAACRVLADTERGLSGTQIERLLQEIEVADTSPGMAKLREDGKVGYADKANSLDAARARAGRLKAALESRVVHAEVLNDCRAELLYENYFHAVFEATKGVAERIRPLSGVNGDGADLVNKAFAGQQPVLALGALTTESEKSEQKGFANLLIGLFGAVRNPLAHAPKTNPA